MQQQSNPVGEQFLICEFNLDGESCSGSLHEFGTGDLVVDTDVTLSSGSELEVRLIRSPALPEIRLDVSVTEELALPTEFRMRHRYRLQIRNLPSEYLDALGANNADQTSDTDTNGEGRPRRLSRAHLKSGEAEWARTISPGSRRSRRKWMSSMTPEEQGEVQERPAVVVVDSGELDDVAAILEEHGVGFSRTTVRDASELGDWMVPSSLLVTTPRIAVALRIPSHGVGEDLVSIAIGDIEAATLQHVIQRAGFQYLVRRPVHPEALRLLLLQAIYRGRNRRGNRRLAIGCEVKWWQGWRRRRDLMLDVSRNGCRLLIDSREPIGHSVKVRVPPGDGGGRGLVLRGHIVRCESVHKRGERARFAVSVAFEYLRDKKARQLERLLAQRASGPATLDDGESTRPPAPTSDSAPIETTDSVPAEPGEIESTSDESKNVTLAESGGIDTASGESEDVTLAEPGEAESTSYESEMLEVAGPHNPIVSDPARSKTAGRRRTPRRVFRGEVITLAPDVDRVIHTLVGRDLSREGLRIEAHPLMTLGDHLRVGLYDAYDESTGEPLIVNAVVARDDGVHGLLLRFEDTDPATLEQIDRHMNTLTPIESLNTNDGDTNTESVVFADLFTTEVGDAEVSQPR